MNAIEAVIEELFPDFVMYENQRIKHDELPAILLNEIQKLKRRIELLEKDN